MNLLALTLTVLVMLLSGCGLKPSGKAKEPDVTLSDDASSESNPFICEGKAVTNADFIHTIKPMFDTYCNTCHSMDNPAAGIEFVTEGEIDKWHHAKRAILAGRMPPEGGPQLSACEVSTLKIYLSIRGMRESHSKPKPKREPLTQMDPSCFDDASLKVTFEDHIKPFVQKDCVGCHSGANLAGGLEYETEGSLNKWKQAQAAIVAGRMPPGGQEVSRCDAMRLKKYVYDREGLEMGECDQFVGSQLSFEQDIKPIMEGACISCHVDASRGIRLDVYDDPEDFRHPFERWSLAHKAIESGFMPPGEFNLNRCETAKIGAWIDGKVASDHKSQKNESFKRHVRKIRLSNKEISNTILDIFGADFHGKIDALQSLPTEVGSGELFVGESSLVTKAGVLAYNIVGQQVSHQLKLNPEPLKVFSECISQNPSPRECFRTIVKEAARYFERRRIGPEYVQSIENALYSDQHSLAQNAADAMEYLIQSPYFLYKIEEKGQPTSGYERATRLAFAVWKSSPDRGLLDLAESGGLQEGEGFYEATLQMFKDPRAKRSVEAFFHKLFHTGVFTVVEQPDYFLKGLDRHTLLDEAREEFSSFISHTIFEQQGSLTDLLTSPLGIVKSPTLAALYGVTPSVSPQALPNRSGILTRAAFLYQPDIYTSPVKRAVHVRRDLLCETLELPALDPDNPDEPEIKPPENREALPNRQLWEELTASPGCMGCHTRINAVGFPFEEYDNLGRHRSEEEKYNQAGEVVRTFGIDLTTRPFIEVYDQREVDGTQSLVEIIATSEKAGRCLNRQLYRYLFNQHETREQRYMLDQFKTGANKTVSSPIMDLLKDLILRPEFLEKRTD